MNPVYAIASNIVSSLGVDTAAHWNATTIKRSGIRQYSDEAFSDKKFWASKIDVATWQMIYSTTKAAHQPLSSFEQMALYSAQKALEDCTEDLDLSETVFILSTTKGNIEWLGQKEIERLLLTTSANIIAKELTITHKPIVISQACISGVVATLYALRLLESGRFKHAVVTGADRFTKFVLNGFQSFQAIADAPCKPFDKNRTGINLGEAAATIIFSTKPENPLAQIVSGATSNDANHISGPSRTGEELAMAINKSLKEANVQPNEINIISAHGTATPYNDEMESKAFGIANVAHAPLHSFKSYIGHTLGAAGIAETALLIESLRNQTTIPSLGFDELGVPQPLNVTKNSSNDTINYALKTASGFGGCNVASVWKRASNN